MSVNEFVSKPETMIGKYAFVSCRCGWQGTQAALLPKPQSKNRECPQCRAEFVRSDVRKRSAQ